MQLLVNMSSAVRRLAVNAGSCVRQFTTSPTAAAAEKHTFGQYHYDPEHGPFYLDLFSVPNFKNKLRMVGAAVFTAGFGIPCFAVWWQNSKA